MTKHRTKEERREEILQAAARCFAEKGYYETTMDDIVAACGLSKGTLYWHFDNKMALFRCLVDLWWGEILQRFVDVLSEPVSVAEKFRLALRAMDESATVNPELIRAQLEFLTMAVRDPELLDWLRSFYNQSVGLVEGLVQLGIDSGEFRAVDARALAQLMVAAVDGGVVHREILGAEAEMPFQWETLADAFMKLLEAPGHE
jgi:AcrR family transcriptional regulator